ncbi:hypothetical protein [Cyanobium gracile]|uniref:Uncharacterized protein n=1 Tax=Cyanobium gracile UHCC 0281 TaxID=3110309 RepID=A0ABU5SZ62_9CYAN|nr:hypothetical protein [Cyanobium gracile]MEA5443322.1 hypothetical protein [Cyanobium gracile UHCC 0281]
MTDMISLRSKIVNRPEKDFADGLLDSCDPPCLSLYQSTHRCHPENLQDPIRFGNLVKQLEASLRKQFQESEIRPLLEPLLEPFLALAGDSDFWAHTLDGLAVLGGKGLFRVYKLQRQVGELAVVADSFHVKPLMRILQSADRYQVLAVSLKEIKLFEGNRDVLDEIDLAPGVPRTLVDALGEDVSEPHQTVASYGGVGVGRSPMHHGHGGRRPEVEIDAERFFRAVDGAVLEEHSRPSGLPLILAALPEHHHRFHEVSQNPFLIKESIDLYPDDLSSTEELCQLAWTLMEPNYRARLAALVEEFGNARSAGLGDDDLEQVATAVMDGRVAKLLIEAQWERLGRISVASGDIQLDKLSNPEVDDMLDDLGRTALKKGAEVVIVPAERIPTKTGIAAIYRY